MGEGYNIGFAELYSEIKQLAATLSEYTNRQDLATMSQDHKLTETIKDLEELRSRVETEKEQREDMKRRYQMALLTSFVFPIVLMVGAFILSKGG